MRGRIRCRVSPLADRSAIIKYDDGFLHIRIHANPRDNQANQELIQFLAGEIGVPRSTVRVSSGSRARIKTIEFKSLEQDELIDRVRQTCKSKGLACSL
ncbi:MAG: DUF167 domain-containing protein [Gammaproteobacteria bacterium]|nr:DUF167 domain-containing protein [Gammaproteobacteria bacterium]